MPLSIIQQFRLNPPASLAYARRSSCREVAGTVGGYTQSNLKTYDVHPKEQLPSCHTIGLYRDVWIAAIASSTTSLATRTAAICVRFQGRRVRRVYVTIQITFLTRKSALIYRRGLRQRVASLTLNCNGDFAIRAYAVAYMADGQPSVLGTGCYPCSEASVGLPGERTLCVRQGQM